MRSFSFLKKTAVLTAAFAAVFSMTSFADGEVKAHANGFAEEQRRFPFDVELTEETTERKCYTGYGKKYQTGYAITPDAEFSLSASDPTANAADLKIELDMIYLNDSGQGNKVEKVNTYDFGDLAADGTTFSFFTDRNKENLEERGKLYSDSQRSLRMTLTYRGDNKKTEKEYYQVFTDDDLMYYIENADAVAAEETEAAAEVYYSEETAPAAQ